MRPGPDHETKSLAAVPSSVVVARTVAPRSVALEQPAVPQLPPAVLYLFHVASASTQFTRTFRSSTAHEAGAPAAATAVCSHSDSVAAVRTAPAGMPDRSKVMRLR